jgi:hypothetical protein
MITHSKRHAPYPSEGGIGDGEKIQATSGQIEAEVK